MDLQEILRAVGALTEDDQLVRGALTGSAVVLGVVLTAWRALRRKDTVQRVRIDAPSNVRIEVEPQEVSK